MRNTVWSCGFDDSAGGMPIQRAIGADELAEGVVSLKMILDHLTNQQARTLIRCVCKLSDGSR